MVAIASCLALSLVIALLLVRSHSRGLLETTETHSSVQSLLDRKERALQVLKDLELDYATQRLSKEEYDESRERLVAEAAATIDEIDRSRGKQ